jgi:hypothetical protein
MEEIIKNKKYADEDDKDIFINKITNLKLKI